MFYTVFMRISKANLRKRKRTTYIGWLAVFTFCAAPIPMLFAEGRLRWYLSIAIAALAIVLSVTWLARKLGRGIWPTIRDIILEAIPSP